MNRHSLSAPPEGCSSDQGIHEAIDELHSANQMLADFAALVTHDMRGALRRVLNFSELLGVVPSIEADPHTGAFLRTIVGAARRIQHLVNETLSYRSASTLEDSRAPYVKNDSLNPAPAPQRLAELRAIHTELAESASSLAEVLRNQLSQILGVAGMLVTLPVITANPVSRDMAAHVLAGAKQMQRLIDDYLSFIQAERHALKRGRVSIESLVQLSRHDLESLAAGRKVVWPVGPLPEVEGDASMLRQVILNLLSNALKYTRHCSETRIEIGAETSSNEWILHVKDNGIGFDSLAAQSLFRKFGRLHTDPGFEGAGVGLMIVKHIIHRHGGRVWAKSASGHGACFYFTLPFP
jgi:signal transduction histidine kinase